MSLPSITDFKERLQDGGARSALFQMEITWPAPVLLGATHGTPNIPFHCKMSEIPGSTISTIPLKFAGRTINYGGFRTFSPLSITVLNDEGFKVRRALESWVEMIQSKDTNVSVLTAPLAHGETGYGGTGRVIQYKKTGEVAKSFVFVDMYPTKVAPIPVNWEQEGIEEYTVDFEYQHWVPGEDFGASVVANIVS